MAFVAGLRCLKCGSRYELGLYFRGCEKCKTNNFASNLTVDYDFNQMDKAGLENILKSARRLWDYSALLPIPEKAHHVGLGEGGTPLLPSRKIGSSLAFDTLYFKNEAANPTCSFKDRFAAVAVSMARALGARAAVVSSTGNHGGSAAAYCAAANIPLVIFTLASAPTNMVASMRAYGAKVIPVTTSLGRWELMQRCVSEMGMLPLSTFTEYPTGNPYGVEGYKTIAYEIVSQMSREVPDYVVVPVGYGEGLYGIWKGFKDLFMLGLTQRKPRLISAETVYGAPLHNAYNSGLERVEKVNFQGPQSAFSIATSVCGYQALVALKESNGIATTVDECEMFEAQAMLARNEGLFVEPSSAVSVAAFKKLAISGKIDSNAKVVCILTSSGLKQIEALDRITSNAAIKPVEPDWGSVKQIISPTFEKRPF